MFYVLKTNKCAREIKREVEKVLTEESGELDYVPDADPPTPHHRREGYSPLLHGRTLSK